MRLLKIIVASIFLFMSVDIVRAQVSSENLVNIHTLTATQISSLVSPAKGSLVFNSDSNKLYVFDGSAWIATASVDTTSLSNRINQRVRYTDTASMLIAYVRKGDTATMLAPYLRKVDTASLSTRIDARVKYSDTSAMLSPYTKSANSMKYSDTAAMLVPYARTSKVLADSTALASNINLRVRYTDTATMLVPYLRKVDTSSLSTRIDARVKYTDTAAMLSPYTRSANSMKYSDTAAMLVPYLRKVDTASLSTRIDARVKYTDTAAMLSPYTRSANSMKYSDTAAMLVPYLRKVDTASLSTRIDARVKYTDTAAMLSPYTRSANSMKYSDTAAMLVPYLRKVDTASLSTRIDARVKYTDTAAMLSPYTRSANSMKYSDTAAMLTNYLNNASNGLTKSGKTVQLGGTLTTATTITNSGANTLRISGLVSGDLNDSLVVADPTTGELLRVSSARLSRADSTTASNGLTLTSKDVRLGGNLTAATTITNNTNTLTIATGGSALNVTGLTSGAITDSLVTVNAGTGRINRIAPSQLNKVDSTTASNGLTLTGKDVRLGGNLTAATTITTTGVNTLSLSGLQSGSTNDSVIVSDASSGLLKRISSNRLISGWSLTGNSGTVAGTNFIGTTDGIDLVFKVNNVESGRLNLYNLSASYGYNSIAAYKSTAVGYGASTGANTEAVTIGNASTAAYRSVSLGSEASTSSNNSVALGQAATASYQATALGSTASATGNNSTAIGFGATTSQANALILGNSSAQVGIGTSTPGYALDVNATTNPLKLGGLVSGALTDSLLTVNTSGVVRRIASSQLNKADSTTASNGLTLTGKDVRLGGSLTAATTVTTTATNTLAISGLQTSSLSDSVLMISSGNVVRRINSSSVALEPFNVVGGTTKASTNTQDIYTQGNLSVGKTTNVATLDVGGRIKADSNISAPNFSSTYQDFGSAGGAITWNMQSGATAGIRLTSNGTITISNVTAGMYGLIRVTQDGTGGRTLTLPSGSRVINSGGSATVVLTQTANAVDILTFFYDGTNYWWTIGNNY